MKKGYLALVLFFLLALFLPASSCNISSSNTENSTISSSVVSPLATVVTASAAVSPQTVQPIDVEKIIVDNCIDCHWDNGCDFPPAFYLPGKGRILGFAPDVIEKNVRAGNGGGMPSFQDVLSEEEIEAVIAYLSWDSEAQPPPEISAAGPTALLFWDKCSGCHGVERQGGVGPALIPQRLSEADSEELKETIDNGRPGTAMPPWRDILTEQQEDDLIDYILSPVQESVLSWGKEDMCAECATLVPEDQLPSAPTWGGRVEDLMVVTERELGRLLFIDSSSNSIVKEIEAGYAIHAPTFTPGAVSDRWLWAIARNGWLLKIDLYSLQVVAKIRVGLDSRGTAVSTDGKYVMVGNYIPNTAVILSADTLEPLKIIEASGEDPAGQTVKSRIGAVLSTPIGPYFEFALKEAGQVWIVDYSKEDFPVVKKITDVGSILHDGFLTADGRYLQIASQQDGIMAVIDLETMSIVKKIPAGNQPHPGPGAVFESRGRTLAATPAIGEGLATIWDTATWEVVKTIETPGPGMFIRSHPDSRYVWVDCSADSGSWDNVVVFDRETLEIVATIQPGERAIHPEFTPDGSQVYIGCWNDDKIVVYDASTLEKITEIAATTPTGIFSAGIRQEEPGA